MKKTLTIFFAVAVVLTVILSVPTVEAQTKKTSAKSEKKEAPKKSTSAKEETKLSSADKAELKEAQELLKALDTYKKGQLTRLLNSGKKAELVALPGIGDTTADRIIAARPLESSAHLVLIKGIGVKTFAEIVKVRK